MVVIIPVDVTCNAICIETAALTMLVLQVHSAVYNHAEQQKICCVIQFHRTHYVWRYWDHRMLYRSEHTQSWTL